MAEWKQRLPASAALRAQVPKPGWPQSSLNLENWWGLWKAPPLQTPAAKTIFRWFWQYNKFQDNKFLFEKIKGQSLT